MRPRLRRIVRLCCLLPALQGNDGDEIDGGGAILTTSARSGLGLLVSSSNITLHNLQIKGFYENLRIDPMGAQISNIHLHDMAFADSYESQLVAGTSASNGAIRCLTIERNSFQLQNVGFDSGLV